MPQAVVGFDYGKYERLQNQDQRRKEKLEQECEEAEKFVGSIEKSLERRIFQMYFIDGAEQPTQKEVAKAVHMERSSISKKIDDYLQLSHNSHDSHL